jgi:hypothetical protein
MAATDRPVEGATGVTAVAGASVGIAGSAGTAGVAWAKAWPDTNAIAAITEIIFFILKSFSLKKPTTSNITRSVFYYSNVLIAYIIKMRTALSTAVPR